MSDQHKLMSSKSCFLIFAVLLLPFFLTGSLFAQTPFPLPNWWENNIARPSPIDGKKEVKDFLESLNKQGKLPFTEEDAIRLVLESNLEVTVDRLDPRMAASDIQSAARAFDPKLTFIGGASRAKQPQASSFLTLSDSLSNLTHQASFSYSQLFQSGTNFKMDFNNNRFSNNNLRNLVNPYVTNSITVTLAQPLLRNFGFLPNNYQIRIAKNNKLASDYLFEQRIIQLINTVQSVYWDLVFSQEDIKVKQRSLALAQKTHSDNQRQVEIGTLAPIELVKSETEIANRQQDLTVAEFTFQQSVNTFKKYVSSLADPGTVAASVDPIDKPLPQDTLKNFDLAQSVAYAIEARPEIKQARKLLDNSDIQTRVARNQLLPRVDLQLSYGGSALEGRSTNINPATGEIIESGLGSAISTALSGKYPTYTAGVSVEIPIFNRGARADYTRYTLLKQQAENRLSSLQQQVALEVRNTYTQLEMKRAQIDIARKARELQERTLDAEQKKFQLGTSTIRFVLEEQRNLALLQSNEIRAMVDFTKAKNTLDVAMGRTLETHKIKIEDALGTTPQAPNAPVSKPVQQ
jgi:outer membrane protein TolC